MFVHFSPWFVLTLVHSYVAVKKKMKSVILTFFFMRVVTLVTRTFFIKPKYLDEPVDVLLLNKEQTHPIQY